MVRGKTKPLAIWQRGVEPSEAHDNKAYEYLEKCCLGFSKTQSIKYKPNDVDRDNWEELPNGVTVPTWNLYSGGE